MSFRRAVVNVTVMDAIPSAEPVCSFDLDGSFGPVRVETGCGVLRIVAGKKSRSIPEDALLGIRHLPGSWRTGSSGPSLRIRFDYGEPGRPRTEEIALAADDPRLHGFLQHLERRYPSHACFGPCESERARILSPGHRGVYGLHALHILTPSGIITAMLLLCALILSIILAESMPARSLDDETLRGARLVLLGVALIPAAGMALVPARRVMVIRTDERGLTVYRLFSRSRVRWRDVDVAEPRFGAFRVYRGLFCSDSDRVEVVSSRSLAEIPLLQAGRLITTLRMNLEEAAPFFRELYYRGKVTLGTAEAFGGFIPRSAALACPRAPRAG